MAAQRRRPRLLALAALAVLLLAQQAACATLDTDQAASDDGKVAGGKKAGKEAAAPAPQPARKKQQKVTAAAAPAPAPAAQDSSPSPPSSPSEAAASPAPAEAYCAPGSGCVLYRLIMKVEGAPNPLSQLDASNILAAVNSLAAPVVFEYRTHQLSSPGQLPAVDGATVQDPPVAKATGAKKKETRGAAGADATAANSSDVAALAAGTTEAAATEATPAEVAAAEAAAADAEAAAGGTSAAEQMAQRRLLRARRLGQGGVAAGGAGSSRGLLQEAETANSCPKPKFQFEVQTKAECQEKCNLKVAGKTATVSPTTTTSASGGQLCCDCKYKKDTVPAPTEAAPTTEQPSAAQPAAANGTGWWPASNITEPLTIDGVFVFADAQVLSYGVDPLALKLLEASNTGQLCSTINEYGVNCDGTAIMFQGTSSDIVFVRNTQTTPPSSSGSGGLTTAAIVGIVVGSVVGLCAVAVLVHMVASCRRERIIERASKQRMERRAASYKAAADAAAAAAAENSRWRQNYSDRMAESMRRADEALGRQSAQAHGPSFVEAQDREFARQASEQLSSKKSFGRSSSLKGSPKADDLEQSIDGSLMAGSELSSPQPSVTSSAKGGRSFRNLFGKK